MSDVIRTYRRWAFSLENPDFSIEPAPGSRHDSALLAAGPASMIEGIRGIMATHPAFFRRHNYDWALDPAHYGNPIEAGLQELLLSVISEINPAHRDYGKLGNIAVRLTPTGHVGGEAFIDGNHKYILVPTSFAKFLNAFLILSYQLGRRGRGLEVRDNPVAGNFFLGRDAAAALMTDYAGCRPMLDEFLRLTESYVRYERPEFPRVRLGDLLGLDLAAILERRASVSTEQVLWMSRYDAAEGFVVCHELAHLLRHDFQQAAPRSLEEELDADRHAASLSIILSAKNPRILLGVYGGAATFFHVAAIYLLVRHMTQRPRTPGYPPELFALLARGGTYGKVLSGYGLARLPLPEGFITFAGVMDEVAAVSSACRVRMLEALGARDADYGSVLRMTVGGDDHARAG